MDKPDRPQILEDTQVNFPEIIALGHKPKVIENLVIDMYRIVQDNVRSILEDGRIKAVGVFTLEAINKEIK